MKGRLDVEVHDGKVMAVWLGCRNLPFDQVDIDQERRDQLADGANPDDSRITSITVE